MCCSCEEKKGCCCEESCCCDCGDDCDCGGGKLKRRFQTKAERLPALEAYLADLKLEVQAVEELIADLKK